MRPSQSYVKRVRLAAGAPISDTERLRPELSYVVSRVLQEASGIRRDSCQSRPVPSYSYFDWVRGVPVSDPWGRSLTRTVGTPYVASGPWYPISVEAPSRCLIQS